MEKRTETIGFKVSPKEKLNIHKTLNQFGFNNTNEFLLSVVLAQIEELNNGEPNQTEIILFLEKKVETLNKKINYLVQKAGEEISRSMDLEDVVIRLKEKLARRKISR